MSLAPDVVEALVGGRHGDPFAVLGPHAGARGTVAIRTLQPDAAKVSVVLGGEPVEEHSMQALHPAGLWGTTVRGRSGLTYRLRVTDHEGRTREEHDPYRFPSTLSDFDLHLLGEGTHYRVYDKLGAHPARLDGVDGTIFSVWAPNARRVSVVGDWNVWDGRRHPMRLHPGNGIWELFLPGVGPGARYKYEILGPGGDLQALKADPLRLRLRARRRAHGRRGLQPRRLQLGRPDVDGRARPAAITRGAGQHLRGPSGLVAARAGRGTALALLSGAGRPPRGLRRPTWASPTSS